MKNNKKRGYGIENFNLDFKPLIGIPGFLNSDKMFGVTGNYMEFANKFGDVRIIMPHEKLVDVDMLLLPGGMDLSPSKYGEIPSYQSGNHDVFKQFFFEKRLQGYIDAGTPIFGICLGYQMLNVALGGTLTQNLLFHEQSSKRWETAHEVTILGYNNTNRKPLKIKVNSHHHQGILQHNLAEGLTPIAITDDQFDGVIIEAFKHNVLPIAGVQYHSEELYDPISERLILELLQIIK